MTRITISGIEHLIRLLNQHPQLLALSSLAPINQVAKQAKMAALKAGCNCKIGPVYAANRHVFEAALNNLGSGDHLTAKAIMKVDQLCYYVRDGAGKYVLKCI